MRVHPGLPLATLLTAAVLLAGCGGGDAPPAAGSAANPLRAETAATAADRSNEAAAASGAAGQPGYQELVDDQAADPRTRFSPCNLVSRAQAATILDTAMQEPLEAQQGPTCLYRSRDGEQFVSLAVRTADFDALRTELSQPLRVEAAGRPAFCGHAGQEMLVLPLAGGRVLSVGGACDVARRFAAKAAREF